MSDSEVSTDTEIETEDPGTYQKVNYGKKESIVDKPEMSKDKGQFKSLYEKGLWNVGKSRLMKSATNKIGAKLKKHPSKVIAAVMAGPRWVLFLISCSILTSYLENPKYMDWRWYILMILCVLSSLNIFYSWYKRYKADQILSLGVVMDIMWIFLYINILRLYVIKFDPSDSKTQQKWDGDVILKFLKTVLISMTVIYAVLVVCYILCFVPVVGVPAMRVVYYLSYIF